MRPVSIRAKTLTAGLLLAAFAASGAAWGQPAAPEGTATATATPGEHKQPMILPGAPPDLLLFYTGDVIGYLSPCG